MTKIGSRYFDVLLVASALWLIVSAVHALT